MKIINNLLMSIPFLWVISIVFWFVNIPNIFDLMFDENTGMLVLFFFMCSSVFWFVLFSIIAVMKDRLYWLFSYVISCGFAFIFIFIANHF